MLKVVSNANADRYFLLGQPVLAACCHLAINDIEGAIQKLVRGNEIELAAVLAKMLKVYVADYVFESLALRCERFGMW